MNNNWEKIKLVAKKIMPKREQDQSQKDYRIVLLMRAAQVAVFTIAALAIVRGAVLTIPGAINVSNSVNGRSLPIYCVETEKKQIALSFDAAWGNEDTQKIMDILEKHNVKVTFFMTGGWVESFPDDVKKILAAGHDLGNHSENHKNMSKLSDQECKEELQKVHTKVQELTGYEMFLFRPPYGDYDDHVIKNASELGYFSIQWDVDTLFVN